MQHSFDDFAADLRAQGFDEVVEVTWPPLTVLDTHRHAFAARALVVRGEHGATYWVGRRAIAPPP